MGETPLVSGIFSIAYTAAVVFATKTVRPEHLNQEMMESPLIKELLSKIEIEPSLPPGEYQTAEAEVFMEDGSVYSARCDVPRGDIYKNPLSEKDILNKFYANIEFSKALSQREAEQVANMVFRLEEIDDVTELTGLLQ